MRSESFGNNVAKLLTPTRGTVAAMTRGMTKTEKTAARYLKAGLKILTLEGWKTITACGLGKMGKTVLVQVEGGRVISFGLNTTVGFQS